MTGADHKHAAAQPADRAALVPETLAAFEASIYRSPVRAPARVGRRAGRGIGLGLVLALAGGTALAAAGQWQPFGIGGAKHYTLGQAPADQTATLAVLRRPQDDRDRGPLMTAFLQRYPKGQAGRVYLRYVRELRTVQTGPRVVGGRITRSSGQALLVLIPNEEGSVVIGAGTAHAMTLGSLCMYVIDDGWHNPTADRLGRATTRPASLRDRITGSGTCASPHVLRTKGLAMGAFNGGVITGLVPDGVAAVRATTRAGQTVTSHVVNNSYQLLAPGRNSGPDPAANGSGRLDLPNLSGQFKHQTVEWLNADGHVLRRLPQ